MEKMKLRKWKLKGSKREEWEEEVQKSGEEIYVMKWGDALKETVT